MIKPLAIGALYHEEWADILAAKVGTGMSKNDRDILPKVLKTIKLDISKIGDKQVNFGKKLDSIFKKRNDIIHNYDNASESDAKEAILCSDIIINDILPYIFEKYKIDISNLDKWKIKW